MLFVDYFEIVEKSDHLFYFKLKGDWDDDFVKTFSKEFLREFQKAVNSLETHRFVAFADLSELTISSEEVKPILGKGMQYALDHGMYKTVQLIPHMEQKLWVDKASVSVKVKEDFRVVVPTRDEAVKAVLKFRQELNDSKVDGAMEA